MTITIRAGRDVEDVRAAIAPIFHYFGLAPRDEAVANFNTLMTPARTLLAQDGNETVGGCGSFPLRLTTPGGNVATCGLSMVGVMPTHRRQGVLSGMIRRVLDECRERGEPVAYLWASEERIYGRYGFGITGLSGAMNIARDRAALIVPAVDGATIKRLAPADAAEPLSRIFASVAAQTPGAFARTPDWWRLKSLADPLWRRNGGGELQCTVVEFDGAPAAYALYRMNFDTDHGVPTGAVQVVEAVGTSPRASAAIWRFLLEMDWVQSIKADYLPLDHFLLLSAFEPRRLGLHLRDGAWLRIVDVERALAQRSYGSGAEIVVEIADAHCPHNAGRWRIAEGGAERTTKLADLTCAIDALASVYLGGFTWRQLIASGRVAATDETAVKKADRVFERGSAPWCPEIF